MTKLVDARKGDRGVQIGFTIRHYMFLFVLKMQVSEVLLYTWAVRQLNENNNTSKTVSQTT